MAMSSCRKCLENNWKYDVIENIIRATCQSCSNEVEFASRKKKRDEEYFKNKRHVWVRFENDGLHERMFTDKYPDGIYVRLNMNVNLNKVSPIIRTHKPYNVFQHIIDFK